MILILVALTIFGLTYCGAFYLRKRPQKSAVIAGVGLTLALIIPHLGFTKSTGSFFPLFTVVLCATYALFALGLNVVVGYAGLLDLGYVAFFLFGAYVGAFLMSDFGYQVNPRKPDPKQFAFDLNFFGNGTPGAKGIHITLWLVLIIAGVVASLIGVVIGAPTLRLKSDYLALVTLGFGEILPELFRNGESVFGYNITNGTKGIGPVDNIGMGVFQALPSVPKELVAGVSPTKYYIIVILCAIFVWISLRLRDGRLGRAWMAIREDELAASLMGVPLMRSKLWAYAVGAFAGGVGGAFYATVVGTVSVDNFTFAFSIIILCAVILGGMGNVWGAILGAVAITWVNDNGLKWMGNKIFGSEVALVKYNFGLFGLVLVLMMLFRPEGFLPAARAKQVKKAEQETLATQVEAS